MFFGGDPFEHFAQAGGGRPGGRASSTNVDTTKLYETLGVSLLCVWTLFSPSSFSFD